jgi:hypothetical protein
MRKKRTEMKILTGLFILFGFINCSNKKNEPTKDICTEKYISDKWKVTIYHSKDWSPYEFYGNNIGLEYKGLQNLERRYDAEIIITFFNQSLTENEFYQIFDNSQSKKEEIAKSFGAELQSKTKDIGQAEFANKKWRTFETEESGSFEGEIFNSRETNYLWYTPDTKISVRVKIKGKEIDGLSKETECILRRLVFN